MALIECLFTSLGKLITGNSLPLGNINHIQPSTHEGTAEYFDVESQFQLDINNDGTIGVPALTLQEVESAGTVALNKDSSGRLYADTMPIHDGAGNHINENIGAQGGWIIGAVDTINGINRMLVYKVWASSLLGTHFRLGNINHIQPSTHKGLRNTLIFESQFQLDINRWNNWGSCPHAPGSRVSRNSSTQ